MFKSIIYIINCRRKAKSGSVLKHVLNVVFVIILSHPTLEIQVLGMENKILTWNLKKRSFKDIVLVKLSKPGKKRADLVHGLVVSLGFFSCNNSVSFLLGLLFMCAWKQILYSENSLSMEKMTFPLLQF